MLSIIPTKIHGALDYISGAALIAVPMLAGYDASEGSFWITPVAGISILLYSIFTRYEAGIAGLISFRTHLILDGLAGILLIAAPYLAGLDYASYKALPICGAIILLVVMLSKTQAKSANGPLLSPNSPSAPPERIGK